MSSVRTETYTIPAASLGHENPLPMLRHRPSATASGEVDEGVTPEDRKFFGYGLDEGWLPHRGQDDYDRRRVNRQFQAIVLENEVLKAIILPEVGGRLWSLVHQPTGRELLFVNPVFQPANLAVRGAWIAGGIEWNACVSGHAPYTCSPVFAAVVEDKHAGDVLRIYEWDRTRCVPYQLDFWLPRNSPTLFVYVRLLNPHAQTIPMYWWSNIALPESPDVRVIAPAKSAYTYAYGGAVHAARVPSDRNVDVSYATNIPSGADYFFRIPEGTSPWIAALDREGTGLVQTSTSRLRGRKLFAWGANPGGRRWQEFLSTPGNPYFEIQAGLARTQMECLPMPGGAEWDWVEAYGLMQCDPAKVHGSNWDAAVDEVSHRLERGLSREALGAQLQQSAALADRPPQRILHRGSGWGALERHRRERSGERPLCTTGLVFDDESLGDDQSPWLTLLRQGTLPERDPEQEPGAWMIQREWRELLEPSVRERHGDHWLTHLHLGFMHYADGNLATAEEAWRRSLQRRPSGWAYRCLAALCGMAGRTEEALSLYDRAHQLLPELRPLLVEYCEALLASHRAAEVLSLVDSLPSATRRHSRVQLLEASAGLALGLPDRWQPILQEDYELVDIREGETSLTEFWLALQSRDRPDDDRRLLNASRDRYEFRRQLLPAHLNFQVIPGPPPSHGGTSTGRPPTPLDQDSAKIR